MDARKKIPDFFGDEQPDPVQIATGNNMNKNSGSEEQKSSSLEENKNGKSGNQEEQKNSGVVEKKKVGYYLPVSMLDQLDRIFYGLKLKGVNVKKNDLVEALFALGLEDMEKGEKSRILKRLSK